MDLDELNELRRDRDAHAAHIHQLTERLATVERMAGFLNDQWRRVYPAVTGGRMIGRTRCSGGSTGTVDRSIVPASGRLVGADLANGRRTGMAESDSWRRTMRRRLTLIPTPRNSFSARRSDICLCVKALSRPMGALDGPRDR